MLQTFSHPRPAHRSLAGPAYPQGAHPGGQRGKLPPPGGQKTPQTPLFQKKQGLLTKVGLTHSVGWIISNSGAALFDRPAHAVLLIEMLNAPDLCHAHDPVLPVQAIEALFVRIHLPIEGHNNRSKI